MPGYNRASEHAFQGSEQVVTVDGGRPLSFHELAVYRDMDVKSNSAKVFKDAKRMAQELAFLREEISAYENMSLVRDDH